MWLQSLQDSERHSATLCANTNKQSNFNRLDHSSGTTGSSTPLMRLGFTRPRSCMVIDVFFGMAVEQRLERVGRIADGIDVAHLTVGDRACEQRLVFRADLMTGEERVLAGLGNFLILFPTLGAVPVGRLSGTASGRTSVSGYIECLRRAWRNLGCARAVLQARGGRP